ncbi:toll-like receptor 7 [Discoglossus pictus]
MIFLMLCFQILLQQVLSPTLLLIFGIYLTAGIIPRFLPCDDISASVVICSDRRLKHIPHIHSEIVTSLNLSHNELELISNQSFSRVPNLEILDVSYNCIPNKLRTDQMPCKFIIKEDALVNLKKLKILELSGNSLTTIPLLPENIEKLYLNLNRIVVVSEKDLSGLYHLTTLKIGWNCYYRNPCGTHFHFLDNAFRDINSLETLVIAYNNISCFPQNLPSSLIKLDLSENKIWKVDHEDLCKLPNLQDLNLQWNCQRCDHAAQPCFPCLNNSSLQLGPGAFDCLHNLYRLNLRGNSFHTLNDSIFDRLSELTHLVLSDNYLNLEVETFFSKLTKLTSLYIDFNYRIPVMYNRLDLHPSFAKMKSLRKISIAGYFFNVLDEDGIKPLLSLPNLEEINLRTNFILKVNLSIFASNKNLQFVSLAENLISFPEICDTEKKRTRLSPPLLFREDKMVPEFVTPESNKHIEVLVELKDVDYKECWQYKKSFDVSFNNIGSLHPNDFVGMGDIECLNMSYNYINQRLNGTQFGHMKSLRHLDLSHNRFDLYYKKALHDLPNLKVLNLAHNDYQFMMKGVNHKLNFIENLTSLTELNLNNNLIGLRITQELRNPSLEKLLFRNNDLGSLWQFGEDTYFNIFTNLKSLKILDISYNNLPVIPNKVLENLSVFLQNLTISNNRLYTFPWEKIANFSNLIHLDLSFNSLPSPVSNIITIKSAIAYLNLKSNQITSLHQHFFLSFSDLRYLILSDNRIQKVDENSFPKQLLLSLVYLDISGNQFQCNCTAHWFLKFLFETNVTVESLSTRMKCDSPETLRGQSLLSMNPQSCQDLYGHRFFVCSSLLIATWMVITIVWKFFLWDLWYTSQVIMASIRHYSRLPGNSKNEFDAFIAFDTKDNAVTDWVYHELLMELEGPEIGAFHLCLEERDWIAGKSTIENLYEAIYKSKKTVFILTRKWLSCGILHHAFYMSHQRLLDEKQDVVILIILDQRMKMSKYLLTRKRMCPKSFLNWPRNPKAHTHFWHSIRVLLRQDNLSSYGPHLRKHINE